MFLKTKSQGLNIGGEQSGHIILLDYGTTGDGIQSSLKLVEVVRDSGKTLDELVGVIPEWPQVLINVRVDNVKKNLWNKNENIVSFIDAKEKLMGNTGRVLVRTSGTEPIVRVMVEGKDAEAVKVIAEEIAEVVKKELA